MTKDINEMPQFHYMVPSIMEPHVLKGGYHDPVLVKETLFPRKPIRRIPILPPPPPSDFRHPIDVIQVEDHIILPPPPPPHPKGDVIQVEDHIILPPPPIDIFPIDPEIIRDHARPIEEAFGDPNGFGTNEPPEEISREEYEELINTQQEWDRLKISKDEYLEIIADIPVSWDTYGKSLVELKKMAAGDCQTCESSGQGTGGQESVQVTAADGLPKVAAGIKFTGYTYSPLFLAITAAGGGLGFGVSKYFKQGLLGSLTLIAAGLMGASSIAFKVKPPIKT